MHPNREDELVLGLSFLKTASPAIRDFADFLRRAGYVVTLTRDYVRVAALNGDLFDMARELSSLADVFDREHGTLVANTMISAWEFRNCCAKNDCEGDIPSILVEVFHTPEFVATGQWELTGPVNNHRRLVQKFRCFDPKEQSQIL